MALSVSILMVVKNERRNLERSFELVKNQAYDGAVEMVCVDSGSTDGTVEFLRDHGVDPIQIPPQEFHHGRTRNLAASHARHDILACLSGDAIPANRQWLKNLVAPFEDPRVGGVYGRQAPPEGMGPLRKHAIELEYPMARTVREVTETTPAHLSMFRFSNANSAIRRELWQRFRFDDNLLMAEDQGMCRDILMTAKLKIVYEPEAVVIHGHERRPWGELRFAFESGLSQTRMGILRNPAIKGELGYAFRRFRDDVMYFTANRQYGLAAKSVGIGLLKWTGVQLGKRERSLPLWLTRRISPKVSTLPR